MNKKNYIIFWEMILLIGSIPVFRSIWVFCDKFQFMNKMSGIVLSFIIGISICVIALISLNKPDKKQNSETQNNSLRKKLKGKGFAE